MDTPPTTAATASDAEPAKARPVVRDERICLSLPVFSLLHVQFTQCLIELLSTSRNIGFVDFLPGDSLVNRARNNLAHRFVNGFPMNNEKGEPILAQFDWMMFIDTDLIFPAEAVERLYAYAKAHGPNIYAGAYPLKKLSPQVVFNGMPNCKPDKDGMLEVREAGTGFMLIHRDVFTKMREAFADEIRYEADVGEQKIERPIMYDYFTVGVRPDLILKYKRFLSEDWYFCQRWREIGGKVLMNTQISCGHIGQHVFPGNPQEIIEAANKIQGALQRMQKQAAQPVPVEVATVSKEKAA